MARLRTTSVSPAASAKEALHLFEVWPDIEIHLLLVDIVMPEINGIELASRIRAIRPDLPILYFSAYSEQETLRPIIARTSPYIAKPFNSIQLTRSIRATLDAPSAAAASDPG